MEKCHELILVSQLRQGDKNAFCQLHNRYRVALLGSIQLIVKDSEQANDLLQDTFVKVWQRFHLYDPAKSSLFNWLLTLARHTALDFVRRNKLICVPIEAKTIQLPSESYCWQSITIIDIKRVVEQQLGTAQWQVIELAYWQGYTYTEIADYLIMPLGTVKSRIRQSLRQLRPLFDEAY